MSEFTMRSQVIGELPRAQRLEAKEAWYDGLAYSVGMNARKYDWDQEKDAAGKRIPLEERRPRQYNLARYIVDTSTAWLFGEGHFPAVLCKDERDEATQELLTILGEALELQKMWLKGAKQGGKAGTLVMVGKVVNGYPCIEFLPAKHCTRTLGPDLRSITYLRLQYKAPAEWFEELGYEGLDPKLWYWFRREYSPTAELTYNLVQVSADGTPPNWGSAGLDQARSFEHGYGVLCATWVRNLECDDPTDGACSYEGVLDLLDPINVLVSASYRSIKKISDPTLALTGIQDADLLDEMMKKLGSSGGGLVSSPGDAKLLEMSGTGQAAALTWLDRLRQGVAEVSRVVNLDPEKLTGAAQSGYALTILHAPLIELVGELRQNYGPALLQFLRQFLRLVLAVRAKGQQVFLPREPEAKGEPNPDAPMELAWGAFFQPTPQDVKQTIENVVAARAAGLISEETTIGIVAPLLGVEDVQAETERIKAQAAEDDANVEAALEGMMAKGQQAAEGAQGGEE